MALVPQSALALQVKNEKWDEKRPALNSAALLKTRFNHRQTLHISYPKRWHMLKATPLNYNPQDNQSNTCT